MFFKSRVTAAIFSTVFALSFVNLGTSLKAEGSPRRQLSCTNRMIRGNYASQYSGVGTPGGPPTNLLSLNTFDGNGNLASVRAFLSVGGEITPITNEFTGTYQVNSDCTVNLIFRGSGLESRWFGIIVNDGNTILYQQIDSGTNNSGSLERVADGYRYRF